MLSLCPFDMSAGVGAFVIGLGRISSFFSGDSNQRFSIKVTSLCFGYQAQSLAGFIFQIQVWQGRSFQLHKSMLFIGFSKFTPDINSSVAKEDMITIANNFSVINFLHWKNAQTM